LYIFSLKDTSLQTRGIKIQEEKETGARTDGKANARFFEPTLPMNKTKPEI
jgi:hypothetical protein